MFSVSDLNYYLALATLLLQAITIALLVVFLMRKQVPAFADIAESIGKRGLLIGFVVSLGAAVLTLFYSDYLGIEPCPLCWWQRIFMFPQIILFGMALWKRDAYIVDYSIVLSVIGGGIALYQHALQMFGEGSLPCPATGPSCAQRILFEFGYITFPLMAVSLFAFIIVTMLYVRANRGLRV